MITAQLRNLRTVKVETRDAENGRDLGRRAAVVCHDQGGGSVTIILAGADQSAALMVAAKRAHDYLTEAPAKAAGA